MLSLIEVSMPRIDLQSGADLGGGGRIGRGVPYSPLPSGIRPPADPKGPPFDTF